MSVLSLTLSGQKIIQQLSTNKGILSAPHFLNCAPLFTFLKSWLLSMLGKDASMKKPKDNFCKLEYSWLLKHHFKMSLAAPKGSLLMLKFGGFRNEYWELVKQEALLKYVKCTVWKGKTKSLLCEGGREFIHASDFLPASTLSASERILNPCFSQCR